MLDGGAGMGTAGAGVGAGAADIIINLFVLSNETTIISYLVI